MADDYRRFMPVVVCYCQDFLKPDMQHVFRQITSLERWKARVITQRRENADRFPFPDKDLSVLPRLSWRNVRRAWWRHVKRAPHQVPRQRVVELLHETLRLEADVLHIFFGNIAIMLSPFLAASPRPVVVSFHGADASVELFRPAWHTVLGDVFRRARLVLARSESLVAQLAQLGCPPEKLRLQRTGLGLEAWPFHPRTPPAGGAWHFVQACRLVPKKGLPTSLRAFAGIARSFPNATLTLAGDGPLRAELEREAAALGIETRVSWTGFLDQTSLRDLLERAHVFLHPSEKPADGSSEGVPNAMLEAMASGLPVLATRHGGIPEAIDHGTSGLLVAEGDAAALTSAAAQLCSDPALYQKIAQGGRRGVEEKFERRRATAALEACYDEALKPPLSMARPRP